MIDYTREKEIVDCMGFLMDLWGFLEGLLYLYCNIVVRYSMYDRRLQ